MQQAIYISAFIGFLVVSAYILMEKVFGYKVAAVISAIIVLSGDIIIYKYLKVALNLPDYSYGSYEYRRMYSGILFVFGVIVAIATSIAYYIVNMLWRILKKLINSISSDKEKTKS